MHLYLAAWRAHPSWIALSEAQRREILLKLQRNMQSVVLDGAQPPLFFLNQVSDGVKALHRYQIIWQGSEPRHIEGMRRAFEDVAWNRFFERIGAMGEGVEQDDLFEELSTLGIRTTSSTQGQRLARGIAGWFSRLARVFRSEEGGESLAPPLPNAGRAIDESEEDGEEEEDAGDPRTRMLRVVRRSRVALETPSWFNVDDYLDRIGYDGSREPNIQTLRGLHRAHLLHVPFENLDVQTRTPIVLEERRFFEKIISRRRGGACYELNGLFASLLETLGFRVQRLSANVAHAAGFGPEFEHMPLMVGAGERWLVDVGFGETFLEPIGIDLLGEQEVGGEVYRIDTDGEYRTVRRRNDEYLWNDLYRFTLLPWSLNDFARMCDYHQISPSSHFTHSRLCSIATVKGRVTLVDNRLISTSDGVRSTRGLATSQEISDALHDVFGITI